MAGPARTQRAGGDDEVCVGRRQSLLLRDKAKGERAGWDLRDCTGRCEGGMRPGKEGGMIMNAKMTMNHYDYEELGRIVRNYGAL